MVSNKPNGDLKRMKGHLYKVTCSLVTLVKIMGRKCKADSVVDSCGAQVPIINKDCFKECMMENKVDQPD